jgi:RimJ/RimL family protein N-acetyltransferase
LRLGPELETPRLRLRRWLQTDLEALVAMGGDSEVMEHFPSTLSRAETALLLARLEASFERYGYGFWAVEVREGGEMVGFVGLSPVPEDIPSAPSVEGGWRLARAHWGKGIAREGAEAALDYGFNVLGEQEIVAYTTAGNVRSRRLMERLGMRHDEAADFDHPRVAAGTPLAPHVLYRVGRGR